MDESPVLMMRVMSACGIRPDAMLTVRRRHSSMSAADNRCDRIEPGSSEHRCLNSSSAIRLRVSFKAVAIRTQF